MLSINIDESNEIVLVEPDGPLSKEDFESAAGVIDPFIEKANGIKGLVIHTESFPGWDSFGALVTHLRFIMDHHKQIRRVAISTDSMIGSFAEKIANHFVNAEIKSFQFQEFDKARGWVANDTTVNSS